MTTLIVGASGATGRQLVEQLLKRLVKKPVKFVLMNTTGNRNRDLLLPRNTD